MAAIIGRISAHEGYVGLTQAEAKFFISEGYLFLTLGVAWRIASDVLSDRSVGIWSRDEAVIGRLPSLTGPLSTAVAKITRSKHPNSQLLFFGLWKQPQLATPGCGYPIRKGCRFVVRARRKSRDYVYKNTPASSMTIRGK